MIAIVPVSEVRLSGWRRLDASALSCNSLGRASVTLVPGPEGKPGGMHGPAAPTGRSSLPFPTQIRLFVAAAGNHFMEEIAEIFAEGFRANAVAAEVVEDEIPSSAPDPALLQIIVAPHEFLPLFLEKRAGRTAVGAVLAQTLLVNVEQPGSPWFEIAFRSARQARGVFDINRQGVDEFRRHGVEAVHLPLGWGPSLERGAADDPPERTIDLLFMGHHSEKRERFLSRHADRLSRYDCLLILSRLEAPRTAATPGVSAGAARNRLVASSRVLMNIHSSERTYFEWHRALVAMANGCVVVTEPSDGMGPLRDGEHLVVAPLDDIPAACAALLSDPSRRDAIARAAYRFLREEWTAARACRALLERLETLPTPPPEPERDGTTRPPEGTPRPPRILPPVRYLQNVALSKLRAWKSGVIRTVAPGPSGPDDPGGGIRARREAILARLAESERRLAAGDPAWTLAPNDAWRACPAPAVSVVITVFNYARYLADCLRSACGSRTNGLPGGFEVVVVDDASTDCSAALVEAYARASEVPMLLVRKTLNTGLADARNAGIELARAPYVFILDADNWIYPNCLGALRRAILEAKTAAVYGIISQAADVTGERLGLISFFEWNVRDLVSGPYIDAMALFDRERLREVGGYSTELICYGWFGWEDYDLWLKVAQKGWSARLLPRIVASYRVHPTSMIKTTNLHTPNLARYFAGKFADLSARHEDLDRVFGFPRAGVAGRIAEIWAGAGRRA